MLLLAQGSGARPETFVLTGGMGSAWTLLRRFNLSSYRINLEKTSISYMYLKVHFPCKGLPWTEEGRVLGSEALLMHCLVALAIELQRLQGSDVKRRDETTPSPQ